jgi:hypothetical protein
MDVNNAIPNEWSDYVTQTNLGLEVIPSMLYSVKGYVSGVTTLLTFFDTVAGSRPDLTNMQQPNMLPNPESFLIQNIRIFSWAQPQSNAIGVGDCADLAAQMACLVEMTKRGILTMKIGNKSYGPWPLWTLPAHNFVQGAMAATGTAAAGVLANYGQVGGMLYSLFPNLMISPLQQFTVRLEWPGALTDTPIPGGPVTCCPDVSPPEENIIPLQILFDGQLARSIQ